MSNTTTVTEGNATTGTTGGTMQKEFKPIPEGDYLIKMVALDERQTKKGNTMLVAQFKILGNEDFNNRVVFENYIMDHENEKVVEIANSKLNQYAEAIGISGGLESLGNDVTKLLDYLETPVRGYLKQKDEYNGKIESRVAKFSPRN